QLNSRNLITAGVSYEREKSETANLARRSAGVYVQEQFSWADRFFLTAGARYDDNDRFESFATASISAAYLINDQLKVRASLGNGFRAPGFVEIIGFPEFGIVGNEALDPEKNVATDFGFDFFSRNGRGGLSTTVFFNRFSDLIEFTFLVPLGSPNYLNIERAKAQGLELNGFIRAADKVRLGGQYTFTDTEVTNAGTVPGGSFAEGEQLLRRPKHTGGLYAQFIQRRYKLRIDFKYKGQRDDVQFFPDFSSSRVVLPSYWKVDFGVTVPLLRYSNSPGDVAIVFRGENIFNKSYTEIAGFASPARSLFAGLELTF
ncbi:TonB-dependent receptor, partial [Acidobacteria bacterium AH-259-D05]|nr:TonB-dependent receptor [Acidobacteria bacterium AH-259-D05]